jgi:DNA-binding MarR family transcriptional regulator
MIYLRQNILPQLEQAGLIAQEKSNRDGRQMVVFPLEIEEKNSVEECVVKEEVVEVKQPVIQEIPF